MSKKSFRKELKYICEDHDLIMGDICKALKINQSYLSRLGVEKPIEIGLLNKIIKFIRATPEEEFILRAAANYCTPRRATLIVDDEFVKWAVSLTEKNRAKDNNHFSMKEFCRTVLRLAGVKTKVK